ncbi:RNA polymerase subunit sigma [Actinoplanes sp. SE50]|uniref:sigma-70 family RNA polymerase sigma factor n=1 Tax=unclassified Actinoplanes TaxID=2626549 RepID=UPI00023EC35C|nr:MULTISPECIES: sigma-70 family RNA polymerase sigma factor [unclassified Actinoplanes]AEV87534.1 RNA polymerase sigma factor rpoD [Actinoplanes sp. SE50/110]ATO85937.1 RNA polymerase subunit sigma [Actinoplanes sp. SE50]SLM03351.1 RNA polymerase subunit sigma [Actinoplanes sp. SE50/110]
MANQPDTATVVAARAGDPAAIDRLVAGYLPLVYTIVGRALEGHADVDDVVQETMIRVLRSLGELREPEAFRSWLVAITVRQVRDRFRNRQSAPDALLDPDLRDPGADFTDLAITRLELSGQRRETAEATRWMDEDNRELLSLWWLEASGELTRDEIVDGTGLGRQHAAVRIQRMKGQLETARAVVRALHRQPICPELAVVIEPWDGRPNALWRKRIARHTRECRMCAGAWQDLVAAERLLAGMALIAPAPHFAKPLIATKLAAKVGLGAAQKALVTALAVSVIGGGGAAVYALSSQKDPAAPPVAAVVPAPVVPAAAAPRVSPSATPRRTAASPSAKAAVPAAAISAKKGVGVWKFTGSAAALKDVRAGWYYDWAAQNDDVPGPTGVEFVPMIWGRQNVTGATLRQAKSEGRVLLGFNEPDMGGQANMSVEDALAAWPQLQATGMRLVSPAVAYGGDTAGGWLDRFMAGAEAKKLRVDAIALHWYGSDFSAAAVSQFLGYVDAVHQRYGKPIWITEFGLMNFSGSPKYPSDAQKVAFIEGATAGLQKRSYVERYAWFGLPAVGDSVDFGLYRDGHSPTEAGKAYRAAG